MSYGPPIDTIRKHVKGGDWVTLETVFNQPVRCVFREPAGAWIRTRFAIFSFDEQRLDGSSYKELGPRFGACQIKVDHDCDVTYLYGATGAPWPVKFNF